MVNNYNDVVAVIVW